MTDYAQTYRQSELKLKNKRQLFHWWAVIYRYFGGWAALYVALVVLSAIQSFPCYANTLSDEA